MTLSDTVVTPQQQVIDGVGHHRRVGATLVSGALPDRPVIVIGGAAVVARYARDLSRAVERYNRVLERLSSPYFIRPVHYSNGHVYHGRYFYRWVWNEEKGRLETRYVGRHVPDDDAVPDGGFPPPPTDVLDGFEYMMVGNDIITSEDMYERYHEFFADSGVLVLRIDKR